MITVPSVVISASLYRAGNAISSQSWRCMHASWSRTILIWLLLLLTGVLRLQSTLLLLLLLLLQLLLLLLLL